MRMTAEEYKKYLEEKAKKKPRSRQGTYNINGRDIYFRSSWEANYALYLDWLISQGQIIRWEFEKHTFWFNDIKKGTRFYIPDFKIWNTDGTIVFHEVKGYFDAKSKTKMKRMKKYYPNERVEMIERKRYAVIMRQMSGILKLF